MYDPQLSPVLEAATDAELLPLVEFLTDRVTSSLKRDPDYKKDPAHPTRYVPKIVEELRRYGAHSIADRFNSQPGEDYIDIVRDAHRELGMGRPQGDDVDAIERRIVQRFLSYDFSSLPEDARRAHMEAFYEGVHFRSGIHKRSKLNDWLAHDTPGKRRVSPKHASQVLKAKATNMLVNKLKGKAIKTGLRFLLRRAAGPVGLAMSAWDLLGPAYRVTIPAISYIHYLRHIQRQR